jgi:hypothetical protein
MLKSSRLMHNPESRIQNPKYQRWFVLCCVVIALVACGAQPGASLAPQPTPTLLPLLSGTAPVAPVSPVPPVNADVTIQVDAARDVRPISPLIYGLSGGSDEALQGIRPTLISWGGNPSTRYNWKLGNAWNAARDWYYRNVDYGHKGGSASDTFVSQSLANGREVRLALPTLGWVARDNDNRSCSFPQADGSCDNAGGASCSKPGPVADPRLTSVPSDVASITEWVRHLTVTQGFKVRFFAMDNEPELWGVTHYDVHPTCTTYQEILDTYLAYATAVRQVAPQAELLGPVTCCWYFYWNSAAGSADRLKHGNQAFLPWFLEQVRQHDEKADVRTIDVLDIHYYPADLYNNKVDHRTAAHRLRSTRSLYDRSYADESWIAEPVYLIPRMRELIDTHYPGLKLAISEWNWGADNTMNGALAIADVLGIYGREGVYLASYWRSPEAHTPGFFAFRMYTNYDGQGGRFGDTSIYASSSFPGLVSSYAARNTATNRLTLMLINKDPRRDLAVALALGNLAPASPAMLYRYSQANPGAISRETLTVGPTTTLTLPAYSMTLLVTDMRKP